MSRFGWLAFLLFPGMTSTLAAQQFLGKSVQHWRQDLSKTGDDAARRNAAFALGKLGPAAYPAIPDLKKSLENDASFKVKEAAAFAIGEIAKESIKVGEDFDLLPTLGRVLTNPKENPLVRRSAAYALGCLGPESLPALKSLDRALNDPEGVVRQNAAWALGRLGPEGVPSLKKALRDSDPFVQRDAGSSLALLPGEAIRPALQELFQACRQPNSEVRRSVLNALIKAVGPEDTAGAGSIRLALTDADAEVKLNAALTLSNIGGAEAQPAVNTLLEALRKGDPETRRLAAAGIRNIGEHAASAVPFLIQALKDPDPETRGNVAMALGGIGRGAEPAYPPLVQLIENTTERPETRVEACVALAKIGTVPAAEEHVPRLLKVLENRGTDTRVRERIIWALRVHQGRLNDLNVFPTFQKVMVEPKNTDNRMLRFDCAYMLGMLQGPSTSKETLDTLLEFLKDDTIQIYVKKNATVAGAGNESITGKVNVQEIGKGDGRVMAVQALERIGTDRIASMPALTAQLRVLAANSSLYADLREGVQKLLQALGN